MRWILILLAAAAAPAAHVEPTITEAPAGSRAELGFTIEHGCAGSPTVAVAMQLPEGVADVEAVPVEGWTATVEGDVVTWTGGPLPDDQLATFTVITGLPVTPGATLLFPTIQTCEVGEIAWISPEGGESETDNPAPRIVLTDVDPARTTSTAPYTTITFPPSSTTTEGAAPGADDGEEGDDDAGLGAWPYVIGAMALLVGGAGVAVVRSRRS
jgi:uncharacterized protein YcnI